MSITDGATSMVQRLVEQHGLVLFHQSGGCCDGSSPMCYPRNEFRIGARDAYLGDVAGQPFYIGGAQFEYWAHTRLTVDLVPGRGSGFSLEAPEGVRFVVTSRLFTDAEAEELRRAGPVPRGVHHHPA